MNLLETLRVALRALRKNKLRSVLTSLGVIIGVGAVIAMVAIGEGAKVRVEDAFNSMGANLLILLPGSTTTGGTRGGFGSNSTLTWDDLKAIEDPAQVPTVKWAAPVLRSGAQVISEDQNWFTQVYGSTPEYFLIRSWKASEGRLVNASDVDGGTKVVLLGQTVSDQLFGQGASPVGQSVRIKNIPFEVVGVLEKKGQSPLGQDYDDCVVVPVTTFQARVQGGLSKYLAGVIYVSATSPATVSRASTDVTALLRDRHRVGPGMDDDFNIRNLAELASAQEQGTKTMTSLLAAIAAVSLVVGGIGIMNIMLVSVTERTREIGLRMAIGAKPRNILAQFLIEALTLAVMGGLIGVAAGVLSADRLSARMGWPMILSPGIIFVTLAVSGAVGVVFGLWPAWKASRLDPIEALRYE